MTSEIFPEARLKAKLKSQFGHENYKSDLQRKAAEAVYKGMRGYSAAVSVINIG